MTIAAQDLNVALAERRKELNHAIRFYEERGWDDLGAEYRVRLDEIQRLQVFGNVAAVQPETEPELREAYGK